MTTEDALTVLDAVAQKAPELRASGVTRLEIGELKIEIAPDSARALREAFDAAASGRSSEYSDPLLDPVTYGRSGGAAPQFRRVHREEVEQ